MKHQIRLTSLAVMFGVGAFLTGCGDSQAERQAKEQERQRIELEKQAGREHQAAEKAVSDIEKKIGRKPQAIDLNLPEQKKTEPAVPPPKS